MHKYHRVTRMEDNKDFELDVKKTLIANIFYSILLLFMFTFMFFTLKFIFILSIINPDTQLIALIVYMFSVIGLLAWIGYPDLQFKYIGDKSEKTTN